MNIDEIMNSGVGTIKPYVPGRSSAEVMKEYGLSEVIKLASNECALGVSGKSIDALKKVAEDLFVYPDPVSNILREKLAGIHGCEVENITVANGADAVIYELGMALIDQDNECIYPEITFPMYENVVKIMRGKPVITRMKDYSIDLDDILKNITSRTKLIFITNPNNPTGDALPAKELRSFLLQIPSDIVVVLDEAYIQFASPENDPDSVSLLTAGMENLVILRTFSKLYGLAGIRIGYGIAHPDIIDLIHSIKPPFPVSTAGQAMALAALDDGDFQKAVLEGVEKSRKQFYSQLNTLGLEYVPSHTNFILINTGHDCGMVFEELMKRGIIVRPAAGYNLPTCIRVTFGTEEQNRIFLNALTEILEMITDRKKEAVNA